MQSLELVVGVEQVFKDQATDDLCVYLCET